MALDFPVFARGTTPIGPLHRGPGEINFPICCGGLVVNPGDLVVADAAGRRRRPARDRRRVAGAADSPREANADYLESVRKGELLQRLGRQTPGGSTSARSIRGPATETCRSERLPLTPSLDGERMPCEPGWYMPMPPDPSPPCRMHMFDPLLNRATLGSFTSLRWAGRSCGIAIRVAGRSGGIRSAFNDTRVARGRRHPGASWKPLGESISEITLDGTSTRVMEAMCAIDDPVTLGSCPTSR